MFHLPWSNRIIFRPKFPGWNTTHLFQGTRFGCTPATVRVYILMLFGFCSRMGFWGIFSPVKTPRFYKAYIRDFPLIWGAIKNGVHPTISWPTDPPISSPQSSSKRFRNCCAAFKKGAPNPPNPTPCPLGSEHVGKPPMSFPFECRCIYTDVFWMSINTYIYISTHTPELWHRP